LVQAGYDVTLIAQHNKNEIVDGVKIIALPRPRNRFMRIFGLTWRVFYSGLCQRADIYHFHDPELIFIGVLLKLFGKKVIYDIHEDVPKQILNKDWFGNYQIRKFAAFIINIIEQVGTFFFYRIVAATSDIAKKFPKKKTVILGNFPILKLIDNNTTPTNYKENKPVIIYAGGLTKNRGIKEIVQSMEHIGDKAELWLLGKWESEKYKKECEDLEGWKYTKYLGHKSLEEVYSCLKISKVGISILYPVKNYLTSLPVKTFEYMACSLPVVMSNFPYWQEIFRDCALFVDPYDSKDITEKISYILDNPSEAKELGKKGRKLIEEKYSWEAESEKLLEMYNNL
jgi:glycosyltransferase involved in cell wall biosynthesis